MIKDTKKKLQNALLEQSEVGGIVKKTVVLGTDFNIYPWSDKDNIFMDEAKKRLEGLPSNVRENVSRFNLEFDVAEIFNEIPVDIYRNHEGVVKQSQLSGGKMLPYCRDLIYQCYTVVSETGQYELLFNGDDRLNIIAKKTFYRWMSSKPEFLFLMLKAKENFRLYAWKVNPELKVNAIKALATAVAGKRSEKWIMTSLDKDGNVTGRQVTEKYQAPPKWVIDTILGLNNSVDDDDAGQQVTDLTLE